VRQGEKRENGAFEWGLGIQTKSSFEDATAEIISVDPIGDAFKNGVQVVFFLKKQSRGRDSRDYRQMEIIGFFL